VSEVKSPSGMQSTSGSQGELADRDVKPGFETGAVQAANGENSFSSLHQGREGQMGGDRS